ncbi:MAG: TonB-dependent receptor [Edaphobacter sp.]|nr:TonB-dependent receptor [Edaphobacter sp.]
MIGPGLLDLDASLIKNTHVSERVNVQFRLEAFNVINHTNFNPPLNNNVIFDETGVLVPDVGTIDSTQIPARIIQLGAKLTF